MHYYNRDNKIKQITFVWACTENRRKQKFQKNIVYEFGNNKAEGRPRNIWQDEVRDDGRLVGRKGWKEMVYNREEWKKFLRTARNRRILHMPME